MLWLDWNLHRDAQSCFVPFVLPAARAQERTFWLYFSCSRYYMNKLDKIGEILKYAKNARQLFLEHWPWNFRTIFLYLHQLKPSRPLLQTRCRLSERFASAWPELIITCNARGHCEWLHRCSWPPLQLACAAYRLFAHAFRLQTDRKTDITTWLHIAQKTITCYSRSEY